MMTKSAWPSVFMKVEIGLPVFERGLVANHLAILLIQRPAHPFDHFLALEVFFRGGG